MKSLNSSKRMQTLIDWLELPRDVTIQIFNKLGPIDLLLTAQFVCTSWRAIARDPQLYHIVRLTYFPPHQTIEDIFTKADRTSPALYQAIERSLGEAIERSCGQLVEFSTTCICSDAILEKLMHGSPRLKRLRLAVCYGFSEEVLIDAVKMMPLLEEVEFCHCPLTKDVIVAVGSSCPNLRLFRMNGWGGRFTRTEAENDEVFTIVEHMNPYLRSLSLFGYWINNAGLEAILDGFPHLESLDLRRCFNIDVKGDLLKKCQGIKNVRLPYDSTDDYDFKPKRNPVVKSAVGYEESDSDDEESDVDNDVNEAKNSKNDDDDDDGESDEDDDNEESESESEEDDDDDDDDDEESEDDDDDDEDDEDIESEEDEEEEEDDDDDVNDED